MRPRDPTRAFTLIEVLVVVAILALLVAILLPSLKRARTQAKIASCAANSKQIATAISIYQAEENGKVPIMLNWHSGPAYSAPARTVFLSVALRKVEKSLAHMASQAADVGGTFDPEEVWSIDKRDEYEARLLPEHYVCPFERGRQPWDLQKVGNSYMLELWEWSGVMESYQTWLWEDIVRGEQVHSEPYGWGSSPLNGLPKYSVLTWNQVMLTGKNAGDSDILNRLHREWTSADARRLKAGGLSDLTAVYCAIGEHMEMGSRRIDLDSHRRSAGGGTNVIFGDTHVAWVKGTRVGWP
jgi:prepilin-type N-terminal cleavage/methylation domain-containing protein